VKSGSKAVLPAKRISTGAKTRSQQVETRVTDKCSVALQAALLSAMDEREPFASDRIVTFDRRAEVS
jgi:hypothetical protein